MTSSPPGDILTSWWDPNLLVRPSPPGEVFTDWWDPHLLVRSSSPGESSPLCEILTSSRRFSFLTVILQFLQGYFSPRNVPPTPNVLQWFSDDPHHSRASLQESSPLVVILISLQLSSSIVVILTSMPNLSLLSSMMAHPVDPHVFAGSSLSREDSFSAWGEDFHLLLFRTQMRATCLWRPVIVTVKGFSALQW